MTSILKTCLLSLLVTVLEAHQQTEQEEVLTSVEGLPFCSGLKEKHSFVKYFFLAEKDLISLIKPSAGNRVFPHYSVFPVFYSFSIFRFIGLLSEEHS